MDFFWKIIIICWVLGIFFLVITMVTAPNEYELWPNGADDQGDEGQEGYKEITLDRAI